MKRKIVISVLIPTKNREESLKVALDSLAKQNYKNFELVVVDGGSTDGTKKLVESYKKHFPVQWYVKKQGGLISQMNVAYKKAKGIYVVRTDDDVIFSKGWLSNIVTTFEMGEDVGGVTGPTVIPDEFVKNRDLFFFEEKLKSGNLFWRILGKIYFNYFLEGSPYRVCHWCKCGAFTLGTNYKNSLKEPLQEVTNLEACNWAVRKDLLSTVGGFDPIFSGIGEYNEPDAALKIKELGYRFIFNPKAKLNHCPSKSGFFKDRPSSFPRIVNYITFYFRHIKPNTLDKLIRFISYLLFLNCFFIFQFFRKLQINQLGALFGTFYGLGRVFLKPEISKVKKYSKLEYGSMYDDDKYVQRRFNIAIGLIKKDFEKKKKIRVLDVGGYMGDLFLILKKEFKAEIDYVIVDFDQDALKTAKRRGAKVYKADLNSKELTKVIKKQKFDLIFCMENLEHLILPNKVIMDIRKLLKPKGTLIVSLPNENTFFHRFYSVFGFGVDANAFSSYGKHKHFHLPTIKQSRDFLLSYFKLIDEAYYVNFTAPKYFKSIEKIFYFIPVSFWEYFADLSPNLLARGTIFKLRK